MPFDKVFGDPQYNKDKCFVSSRAAIIGHVILGDEVIVAPGASLRADEGTPFRVGRGTNIQDGVVMHGLLGQVVEEGGEKFSIWIGNHCSIAHSAMIHGPSKVGKHSFLGFMSSIHKSELGRNCFVRTKATIENSLVGNNCYIGIGAIIDGVHIADGRYIESGQVVIRPDQAELLPPVPKAIREKCDHFNQEVVDYNKLLGEMYRRRREERKQLQRTAMERLMAGENVRVELRLASDGQTIELVSVVS